MLMSLVLLVLGHYKNQDKIFWQRAMIAASIEIVFGYFCDETTNSIHLTTSLIAFYIAFIIAKNGYKKPSYYRII